MSETAPSRKRRNESQISDQYEPSKQKARREYHLQCDLRKLESASFPSFRKPTEVTKFSTTIRESDSLFKAYPNPKKQDETTLDTPCRYFISLPYKRTLSSEDTDQRSDIILPSSMTGLNFDLNKGLGEQIVKENDNEFMSLLIEGLVREKLVGKSDFVCWRGLLTEISATPYDAGGRFDNGMTIAVQKIGDTYYMYKFDTEEALKSKDEMTPQQKKMTYWGMKFESYVTAQPNCEPNIEAPINYNEEFVSVVKTKLGDHSLLFGGEVDGCLSEDRSRYVEMKTQRQFDHPRQEYSFRRFKLMKWWLQSFLLGIEKILCGFRDDDGFIKRLDWYKISEIPRIVRQDNKTWKPDACLAYLDLFLSFVKRNVDTEYRPYVLKRKPGEKEFSLTEDRSGEFKFLPLWFYEHLSKEDENSAAITT